MRCEPRESYKKYYDPKSGKHYTCRPAIEVTWTAPGALKLVKEGTLDERPETDDLVVQKRRGSKITSGQMKRQQNAFKDF